MKLKPANKRTSRSLSLALLCTLALSLWTSGCCNSQYAGSRWGENSVKVRLDIPYDYLSGEYRQIYRIDRGWVFAEPYYSGGK